jgi:hypothetical protein
MVVAMAIPLHDFSRLTLEQQTNDRPLRQYTTTRDYDNNGNNSIKVRKSV